MPLNLRCITITDGVLLYCSDGAHVPEVESRKKEIEATVSAVMELWPQAQIDGMRNVWIVKPGAKSRGRGKDNDRYLGTMSLNLL